LPDVVRIADYFVPSWPMLAGDGGTQNTYSGAVSRRWALHGAVSARY